MILGPKVKTFSFGLRFGKGLRLEPYRVLGRIAQKASFSDLSRWRHKGDSGLQLLFLVFMTDLTILSMIWSYLYSYLYLKMMRDGVKKTTLVDISRIFGHVSIPFPLIWTNFTLFIKRYIILYRRSLRSAYSFSCNGIENYFDTKCQLTI